MFGLEIRHSDGRLPAFAWPGGYPLLYLTADGGALCPSCANGPDANRVDLDAACSDDDQWRIIAYEINWEDDNLPCDHCYAFIPSAYPADTFTKA